MTPQTAAALRALVTDWRTRADELSRDDLISLTHQLKLRDCADELAAVLTQEGAGESKELKQALDLGDQLADWCNLAGPALKGIMDAYERRIRTDCTPEQLEKRPWECSEWLQARDALNKKPVAELVFTVAAPSEPRAAEGAGAYEYQRLPTLDEQLRSNAAQQVQPTAAAAVPAGGDADLLDEFDSICDALADVGYIQLVKRLHKLREPIRKLHAPAPRGGVTEAADRFAAVLAEARRVAPFGQGGESSGYIAGWNAVLEFIARAYEDKSYPLRTPAAQAQDAGPMAFCESLNLGPLSELINSLEARGDDMSMDAASILVRLHDVAAKEAK